MARIGVDLGGTKIEVAVLDRAGQIGFRKRLPTPKSYREKLKAIAALVMEAERAAGQTNLNVGVGHPGSHNPRTGLIRNANSTDLNGNALSTDLKAMLERPVRCANDANCFALSEALDGAGSGARSVFGVILGTGVGGGYVLDSRIVEGHDGNAGEWGHMSLPWPRTEEVPGPTGTHGLPGSVEAWCSGPGLAADHERNTGDHKTAEEIVSSALQGDRDAKATLERHADRLARSLASVINVLDPQAIVLGGGLSNLPDLVDTLHKKLPDWVFSDELTTRVAVNHHGDSSGVRGAAWLWPEESPTA